MKKCRLCEKHAAANSPTPVNITDMNPPAITAPNKSVTAANITDQVLMFYESTMMKLGQHIILLLAVPDLQQW